MGDVIEEPVLRVDQIFQASGHAVEIAYQSRNFIATA